MIDFNEIILFTKVAEAGSFTGAARLLGLPKSTVSRKISQMEARLGVRLLQRTTRSVKLTELGAAHYERCARIVTEAEEAERAIHAGADAPRGLLRVSAPVEMAGEFLSALISEFLKAHPEIEMELDLSSRFVDLVEEGFDLAIRAGQLPDSSLVARRLGQDRFEVFASPDYLDRTGTPASPHDLKSRACILYGQGKRKQTFRFSGANGLASVTLHGRFLVNNLHVARDIAVAGLGLAPLPTHMCVQEIASGRLVRVLQAWQLPESGIYAVYPSPRHLTPKVRTFIDFLSRNAPF